MRQLGALKTGKKQRLPAAAMPCRASQRRAAAGGASASSAGGRGAAAHLQLHVASLASGSTVQE
jgi:hypothetical protein